MTSTLYEQDYYLWLEQIARLLDERRWHEVDISNLVEEVKDTGRSERRALESNLAIVLLHLLKYKYQPKHRSNNWLASILKHHLRIKKQLKESPSLRPYLERVFEDCYGEAMLRAAVETGLLLTTFPNQSPFTIEETINIDYLPETDTID